MKKQKLQDKFKDYIKEHKEFYDDPKKHLDKMETSLKIFFILYIIGLFIIVYLINNYHSNILFLFAYIAVGYIVFSFLE